MPKSKPQEVPQTNDAAYKEFFSDPRMVRGLLTGLIPNHFSEELDFSTLTKIPNEYVTEDLRHRFNDVVWKVKWKNSWAYLILMLAFQSQPDWLMALRITQYTCLLYSDLAKTHSVKTGGKFPVIFPIVIYTGDKPWNAAQNLKDLIDDVPNELAAYQPKQEYFLLDFGKISDTILHNKENITVQLVRLERSHSLEEMQDVVRNLCDILLPASENQRLRKMLSLWIRILLKRSGMLVEDIPEFNDLTEVKDMLAERMSQWKDEWKEEGLAEGISIGEARGKAQGEVIGEARGKVIGEARGKAIGEANGIVIGKAQGEFIGLNFALDSFLKTRFGIDDIDTQLAGISDVAILQDLLNSAYKATSLEDFKKDLHNKLKKE